MKYKVIKIVGRVHWLIGEDRNVYRRIDFDGMVSEVGVIPEWIDVGKEYERLFPSGILSAVVSEVAKAEPVKEVISVKVPKDIVEPIFKDKTPEKVKLGRGRPRKEIVGVRAMQVRRKRDGLNKPVGRPVIEKG